MIYGLAAYLIWGSFPAFFPLLLPAAPLEILSHRVVWTLVFMVGALTILRGWSSIVGMTRKQWALTALCAVLIAVNWGVYIVAVNSGHVADAAMGYFINPLVTVALGVVFLKERLRALQKASVAIAVVAVVVLTVVLGQPPILALLLAFSFGFYGLVKKRVTTGAIQSLSGETIVLFPLGLGYLLYLAYTGAGTFTTKGWQHSALLMMAGVVTAVPLLLFAKAVKILPLTTTGMIQYITPTMQMVWAIIVTQEDIPFGRWVGFILIWIAVGLFIIDLLIQHRTQHRTQHTS